MNNPPSGSPIPNRYLVVIHPHLGGVLSARSSSRSRALRRYSVSLPASSTVVRRGAPRVGTVHPRPHWLIASLREFPAVRRGTGTLHLPRTDGRGFASCPPRTPSAFQPPMRRFPGGGLPNLWWSPPERPVLLLGCRCLSGATTVSVGSTHIGFGLLQGPRNLWIH